MNYAKEGASSITKHGALEKKMCICSKITPARTKWIQSILKAMFKFMIT